MNSYNCSVLIFETRVPHNTSLHHTASVYHTPDRLVSGGIVYTTFPYDYMNHLCDGKATLDYNTSNQAECNQHIDWLTYGNFHTRFPQSLIGKVVNEGLQANANVRGTTQCLLVSLSASPWLCISHYRCISGSVDVVHLGGLHAMDQQTPSSYTISPRTLCFPTNFLGYNPPTESDPEPKEFALQTMLIGSHEYTYTYVRPCCCPRLNRPIAPSHSPAACRFPSSLTTSDWPIHCSVFTPPGLACCASSCVVLMAATW